MGVQQHLLGMIDERTRNRWEFRKSVLGGWVGYVAKGKLCDQIPWYLDHGRGVAVGCIVDLASISEVL